MSAERYKRKPIKENTVLYQMAFTDNDKCSATDEAYFIEGNTYFRDLKIIKQHVQKGNNSKASAGSTCLVYDGQLGDLDVIVKEFYPDTEKGFFYIERFDEDQKLFFHEITESENKEFQERKFQFLTEYQKRKDYVKIDQLREIVTLPLGLGRYGDSYYIVSPVNQGTTLDSVKHWDTLQQKMKVLLYIADMLRILESQDVLYLDLAPENLLYVTVSDMVQQMKLFDVDGFIDLNSLSDVHEISFHPEYVWPEIIKHLIKGRNFDRQKEYYLIPYAAVYSFGIMMYELLFGHVPDEEERLFKNEQLEKLKEVLYEEQLAPELQKCLITLMKRMLTDETMKNGQVYQELSDIYEKMQMPKYKVENQYDESKYLYFCNDMIQEYPVFNFSDKLKHSETKEQGYKLDVTIVGNHKLREYLLNAILPGCQMLNSQIVIRLIADDAVRFWKNYYEQKNPELSRAVNCSWDEGQSQYDPKIVDGELADIYLYNTREKDEIARILKETKSRYILLLNDSGNVNKELLLEIDKIRYGKKPVFISFIGSKKDISSKMETREYFPFSPKQILTGQYSSSEKKSALYEMGLQIHYNYELTKNPRISKKEIEKITYSGNHYNRSSSERAALHLIYKLASVGITDLQAPNMLLELQKRIFSQTDTAQENFDQLVWLEHKSWTANQIVNGWRLLPMEEFQDFAYEGDGNTWKDNRQKRHPYLVSSKPKRVFRNLSLKAVLEKVQEKDLDELDRVSITMYQTLLEKADRRKLRIIRNLDEIDRSVEREKRSQFEWDLNWLKNSVEDCYGKTPRTNVGLNWEQAVKTFSKTLEETLHDNESLRNRLTARLEEIKKDMEPILEAIKRVDIKQSDEDVVKAIPQIVSQVMGISKLTLIKPIAGKLWQNILSTLMLRPKTLILVAENKDNVDAEQYKKILNRFGLSDITVKCIGISALRPSSLKGQLLVDFTGLLPYEVYSWLQNTVVKQSFCFDIHEMKVRAWDQKVVEMLPYDVRLTVKETLELTGGVDITEIQANASAQLSEEQYQIIWNAYLRCNGFRWRKFISTINREMGKHNYSVDLTEGAKLSYRTGYIYSRVLEDTGLKLIIKKLELLGLIQEVNLPRGNEQGNIVTFKTVYSKLGNTILKMFETVTSENVNPYHFRFALRHWTEDMIQFANKSLHCSMEIPHTLLEQAVNHEHLDTLMEKCLMSLNPSGKENIVIQNVKITKLKDTNAKQMSFVFASDAIREVMKTEGSCLEVMIYYECPKNKVFDDVRLNSKVYWGNSKINNEIDVIGIKNNKSYFISVKMAEPETEFLQEIAQITEQFSMVGKPILISSHHSTKEDTEETDLVMRSKLMGVHYLGWNQIFKEDGTVIVADTIKSFVE